MTKFQQLFTVFVLMLLAVWQCWSHEGPVSPPAVLDKSESYIERYAGLAIMEMQRSGVPASITLAQGILESNYGQSALALGAFNHFGIKCGVDWTGDKFCAYSNEWDPKTSRMVPCLSCFRKYPQVSDCYRDHSDFLRAKERYADLFRLPRSDYANWARGLQKAGYATDPEYGNKLISLIERYRLYIFDNQILNY